MKYISRNYRMLLAMALVHGYSQASPDGSSETNAAITTTAPTTAVTAPSAELTPEQKAAAEAVKAELHKEIKAKFNNLVDVKETSFHFRKVTNEIKDPETGAVSKIETKRPTVVIPIPVPSVEGIIAILEKGEKGLELLQEAVAGVIQEQAREYINAHEDVTEANFPYANLDWDAIANLPKAERRGGGISKEVWEDFVADYISVMPAVTGKSEKQVANAAKVFQMKFAGATTNKPVLKVLQGQLAIYATSTPQGEQFAACIEFLSDKMEKLLNTDETNLLNAL